MNKNKKILIVIPGLVVFVGLSFLVWFFPVHKETIHTIKTCQEFRCMISEGRVSEAVQRYVNFEDKRYCNHIYLKLENEKITYSGIDITDEILKWKCKYWATFFDHFWKRDGEYKKVIFETGYALLKNEKVVYIKIP